MDKDILSFFDAAKKVCLTETERGAARNALATQVTALEVRLTAEEREAVREALLTHVSHATSEELLGGAARDVRLHESEKEAVYDRIHSFMQMHPARTRHTPTIASRLDSVRSALLRPFHLRAVTAQFLVASMLVATGGGFAYAAEDTLPGDTLYPLKVEVTEPLREYFSLSEERRAEHSLRHLNRRFEEANRLLERDAISPEHRSMMEANIEEHMRHMEERLQHLGERDAELATDMSERWEFALEDHEPALRKFMAHGREEEEDSPELARVHGWRQRALRSRNVLEDRMAGDVSPADMQVMMEVHKQRVREIGTSPVANPALVEFMDAQMEKARSLTEQGDMQEAFHVMREGRRAMQRTMEGKPFPLVREETDSRRGMRPPPEPDMMRLPLPLRDDFEFSDRRNNEGRRDLQHPEDAVLRRPPVPRVGGQLLRPPFKERREDLPHAFEEEREDGGGRKEDGRGVRGRK